MKFHFDPVSRWLPSLRRASTCRFVSDCRRASADTGGATAIEFALLLFPFLALILFIMEIGLQLFITSTLDNAIRKASRQIQIGAAHASDISGEEFKKSVCQAIPVPSACDNLILSVTQLKNWTDVTSRYKGHEDRRLNSPKEDSFCLPGEKSFVLVRSFFTLPVVSGFWLVSDPNGTGARGITANHLFRMEPIGGSSSSSACPK
jgi:Flp pilus assembly pilin Flp